LARSCRLIGRKLIAFNCFLFQGISARAISTSVQAFLAGHIPPALFESIEVVASRQLSPLQSLQHRSKEVGQHIIAIDDSMFLQFDLSSHSSIVCAGHSAQHLPTRECPFFMAQGSEIPDSGDTESVSANDEASAALANALNRLNNAMDGLEKAATASLNNRDKAYDSDEQVQRMSEDRARLARSLDDAEARASALKDVNSEVSRRLVSAMETVRGVLDKQGQ